MLLEVMTYLSLISGITLQTLRNIKNTSPKSILSTAERNNKIETNLIKYA